MRYNIMSVLNNGFGLVIQKGIWKNTPNDNRRIKQTLNNVIPDYTIIDPGKPVQTQTPGQPSLYLKPIISKKPKPKDSFNSQSKDLLMDPRTNPPPPKVIHNFSYPPIIHNPPPPSIGGGSSRSMDVDYGYHYPGIKREFQGGEENKKKKLKRTREVIGKRKTFEGGEENKKKKKVKFDQSVDFRPKKPKIEKEKVKKPATTVKTPTGEKKDVLKPKSKENKVPTRRSARVVPGLFGKAKTMTAIVATPSPGLAPIHR